MINSLLISQIQKIGDLATIAQSPFGVKYGVDDLLNAMHTLESMALEYGSDYHRSAHDIETGFGDIKVEFIFEYIEPSHNGCRPVYVDGLPQDPGEAPDPGHVKIVAAFASTDPRRRVNILSIIPEDEIAGWEEILMGEVVR